MEFSRLLMVAAVACCMLLMAGGAHGETMVPPGGLSPDMVGLVSDMRGNLYAADRSTGTIYCIAPDSTPIPLATIPATPITLAVDSMRTVFVAAMDGTIHSVTPDGQVRMIRQLSRCPNGITVDRDGNLLVSIANGSIVRIERASFVH